MPPKVLRRPAGRALAPGRHRGGREGVLRRPALRPGEGDAREASGMWRSIPELSMEEIGGLDKVIVEGRYWEAPCLVAGVVNGLNFRGEDRKLRLLVTGTQTESLLKAVAGRCKEMEVHLCSQPCENQVWNNSLLRGERLRVQSDPVEEWWTNLEDARGRGAGVQEEHDTGDQLAKLRTEMKRVVEGVTAEEYSPKGGAAPVVEGEKEKKVSKKKVKKKEKEKTRPCLEAPLKNMFDRTGVDPDPQARKTMMRKAQKEEEGQSLPQSRERGSGQRQCQRQFDYHIKLAEELIGSSELFEAERRALQIWKRVPGGALCYRT